MRRLGHPPITLAVPLIVAALMIAVSVAISERVMARLVETQERHLADLSAAYLDGLSSSLLPHVIREDVWEVYDTLDRAKALYRTVRPVETVVVDTAGRVIAASDPVSAPSLVPLPERFSAPLAGRSFAIDTNAGRAHLHRVLTHQSVPVGAIHSVLDIGHVLAERAQIVRTLIVTNALLTLAMAAAGYLVVRRMVRPVRVLTAHLSAAVEGRPEPIPAERMPREGSEARRLFEAYNALVAAEREREALTLKLAEEERLASLGRLASGMAHEINNPLGGLFNALDTIRRHGETASVRDTATRLIERGLVGIRDVVAATLQTYRADQGMRAFGPADLEDIALLLRPDLARRRLGLDWENALTGSIDLPNAPVRQAVLNLLLNACAATPMNGRIGLAARVVDGRLVVEVSDGGPGLPGDARATLLGEPGGARRNGLGLWMVRRSVTEIGGGIELAESTSGGALVRLVLPVHGSGRMQTMEARRGAA